MNEWQESGTITEGFVIAFLGINQDEQDKLDMENFARGLKEPAAEDPGGKAFARTARTRARAMTPMDAIRYGLGVVFGLVGYGIVEALDIKEGARIGIIVGFFVLGLCTPFLFNLVRSQQAKPVSRSTADSFRLTISPNELAVEGDALPRQAYDVESIVRVDGKTRLMLHLRDGKAVTLPCSLRSKQHVPLAARLEELVREAKALRGYRGA
jgi:hypothetical protein